MSGRQYDFNNGIPICKNCGDDMLRSDERNFNGTLCISCNNVTPLIYDEEHPNWVEYIKYINDNPKNVFVNFEFTSYNHFKKIY